MPKTRRNPTSCKARSISLSCAHSADAASESAWRFEQAPTKCSAIDHGSLYPALHRLERQDWVQAEWRVTENKQRAKCTTA
jgi:hypothetical protein